MDPRRILLLSSNYDGRGGGIGDEGGHGAAAILRKLLYRPRHAILNDHIMILKHGTRLLIYRDNSV